MFFCNRLVKLDRNILLELVDTITCVQETGLDGVKEAAVCISVCSMSDAEVYYSNNQHIVKSNIGAISCCFLAILYLDGHK